MLRTNGTHGHFYRGMNAAHPQGAPPRQCPLLFKSLLLACFLSYTWYYHGWKIHMKQYTGQEEAILPKNFIDKSPASTPTGGTKFNNSNDAPNMTVTTKEPSNGVNDNANPSHFAQMVAASFPNGTLGYVADPTALRKGLAQFLSNETITHHVTSDNVTLLLSSQPQLYWKLLNEYQVHYRNDTYSGKEFLSSAYTCALPPGRGWEQDYGYRLLSEKIQIDKTIQNDDDSVIQPRILCLVYTYPKMRDLQRTQALSWGYQCNGYLAFSTETIPSLGLVNLTYEGDESYNNMWQKTRSIWMYVHEHYRNDFDFFHLGGDDLYIMVPNLRKFLKPFFLNNTNHHNPVYLGQWIPLPGNKNEYFVSGGPGYTLNQVALKRLVEDALPTCRVHVRASYEDRLISHCFRELNITGNDTRDVTTGEQLYHDCSPSHLYTFRSTTLSRGSFHAKAAAYWETLPHPNSNTISSVVGPKHELQAAGRYSVSFHDIYHPMYMARLHSILYPGTCPPTSALGQAFSAKCNA